MFNKTKFPGKPSKLVNKKRVSVLSADESFDKKTNDRCKIDSEKILASPKHEHGYQETETATTTKHSSSSSQEESEEKSIPVMKTTQVAKKEFVLEEVGAKDTMETSENDSNCDNLDKKSVKKVTFRQTISETSDQCKVKRVYNPNFKGPLISIIKKDSLKYPILVYQSKFTVRPSKLTEIVKNSSNNIDKLNSLKFGREYANQNAPLSCGNGDDKSPSNVIVASKFNLPKLSANSSRVIKPNKRFLFDTGQEEPSAVKKKVIKASPWGEGGEASPSPSTSSNLLKEKKNFGFNFVDELDLKSKEQKSVLLKDEDSKLSILRKPVLQLSSSFSLFGSPPQDLHNKSIKSPFSIQLNSPPSNNSIFTESLACNVCNSITTRKQPKKYGTICCELCKKFMSKMIERVNKHPVQHWQCDKSDGLCLIEPVILPKASRVEFNLKKLCKGRCYACWLKKCLITFQLPLPLKTRLSNILPKSMMEKLSGVLNNNSTSESSNIFLNSLKFPSFKIASNPLAINNFTFGSKPDIKSSVDNVLKSAFAADKQLVAEIPKVESPTTSAKSPKSPSKSSINTSPKLEASPPTQTSQTISQLTCPANVSISESLRQRTLLKGPRVKHVCRSASLVLGLPIAVFPGGESESHNDENAPTTIEALDENSEKENLLISCEPTPSKEIEEKQENKIEVENSITIKNKKEINNKKVAFDDFHPTRKTEQQQYDISKPITRKVTRPNLTLSQTQNANRISSKPVLSKRLLFNHSRHNINNNLPPMISIDFWENYDPAEVSRTGFGLVLSEKTPIKSVCFLCGSYGSDPLIFCVCCCECYHFYCVEDEFNVRFKANSFLNTSSITHIDDSMNISEDQSALVVHSNDYDMPLNKKLNWLCPRCTVCYTCNMSTGVKVKCWKCEKNFHTTCLGTSKRLLGADRPLICATCLKCKSCGTTNVTKFIGNLGMCSNCFRLRRKGNYCPLCQKCYENNDYDVKMMECGDCKRWVHSKCEGLTDEQYNLLSVLPEHIEFICKKCSPNNSISNIWRESVEAEFKTSLLSVIKLLSKSRHACALLRMSPRKKNSRCFCQKSNAYPMNFNSLFDALKTEDSTDHSVQLSSSQCTCFKVVENSIKPNIGSVKQSIHDNKYHSLQAFNYDMNKILSDANSEDLTVAYNEILSEIFPWYQNETKACTDALEETMNDHSKGDMLDELIIENENSDYYMMTNYSVPESIIKNGDYLETIFFNDKDNRVCMFCKKEGECSSDEEGRLLYCGHNTWVHTNCALWSAEVYEEIDGSLQNVHSAISRGRLIKCSKCGMKGATVGCNFKNCGEQYHFQCARSMCEFRVDKRVFCPQHFNISQDENGVKQIETNFQVNRSVYVELDRRKKKTVEASKVQFLIGSLCITKLGRIVPILSDAGDYLIPIDFECTRLFWSSKQPWNIVEYKIRISIQRSCYPTITVDKGINFTVDHTKSMTAVQKNLKQIAFFHNSVAKEQEAISLQDETQDEEPQNNNDLLPPEIKAAIFEDLPHDVLDGISMFDIFPKDPADTKTVFFNPASDEDDDSSKSNQVNGDGDGDAEDSDFNGLLNSIQYEFSTGSTFKREDPQPKKRKLSLSPESNDSNNNPGGIKSEKIASNSGMSLQKFLNQQNELKNRCKEEKIPQLDGLNDEIFQTDGPVACEKCRCTYRNRNSYERHLATCEIIQNTSESDSDLHDGNHVYHLSNTSQTIAGISLINQQQNQSMATSIPIVINSPFGQSTQTAQNGITLANGVQIPNLQNLSLTLGNDGNLCQNVIVDQQGQQIFTAQPLQLSNFGQTATLMPLRNYNQNSLINNGGISYINTSSQQQPTQYIQLAPASTSATNTQLMTITTTQATSDVHEKKKPLLLPSPIKGKPVTKTTSSQYIKSNAITKKKLETNSTKSQQQISLLNAKNVQISNYQTSSSPRGNSASQTTIAQPSQNIIFQQPAQQVTSQINNYPIILNQNGQLVQYIPADSGQNGSQIQYISQIGGTNGKDLKNSQNFITSSQSNSTPQIFQNAFQLPSNNSTGNLVLTSNGLSVMPQSPIVGTLIQQPQTLQCVNGVVSTEQMMLGSTPTALEMDPSSGCMYLTSQPVYYGLETIVQNTVMSSQQFVSTAMQGICQNSSFSATTTQVFQASKIEPIQMEIPAGYVFLNANDGTIHQPQIMDSSWNVIDSSDKKSMENCFSNLSNKTASVVLKPSNQKPKVQTKVNKIQPQIVSKVIPTTSLASAGAMITSLNTANSSSVLKTVNESPHKAQIIQNVQQPAQIQVLSNQNNVVKKQKATYRTIGPKIPQEDIVKIPSSATLIKPKLKVQAKPVSQNNYQSITIKPALISSPIIEDESQKITLDQTYRNVQNNIIANNQKPCANSSTSNVQTTIINLPPTNVVNPIQQQNSIFNKNQNAVKPHFQNRPTNRVLPMPANATTTILATSTAKNNGKVGNIAKAQNNSAGSNLLRNSASPLLTDSHSTPINNSSSNNNINNNNNINVNVNINALLPSIQSADNENFSEKINSIAMELQSSKADELFDALRRSSINNVITVTASSESYLMDDNKVKSPEDYQIPSTSASNIPLQKLMVTKTASVSSLTKTIDSVATGANLLDDRAPIPSLIELIPPSITITPIDTESNGVVIAVDKINLESMFEELPELKASKDVISAGSISAVDDESQEMKIPEKNSFQTFDEETSSDRPSSTSLGSTYATKASREKTPTSTIRNKISTGPKLLFEIQSQDGFTYKSTSISEIWEKLFETVQLARKAHGLMPLPEGRLNEMTGEQMLGLKTNALKYLLEQLPGVEKCVKYSPKYHRRNSSASSNSSTSSFSSMNGNCSSMSGFYGTSSFSSNASNLSSNSSISTSMLSMQYMNESDEILYENIYGCARFEPFNTRSDYDMFSWLASRHRLPPMPVHLLSNNDEVVLRRGTGSNLPMAMKYRTLKETYKKSVGVYRSHIHGRGLFCTRDIEAGEMVIEYAGELIRSTLTDKRERFYDSKGIGCYMFKIDENLVVDATMSGTAARFINHSCDPNCYSKVVDILGQKHIIIFALRRIVTGEELTYDYKFDIEENKIPCGCGAKRCRKYMN